ncbi:hypothetical protein, partial [Bradyrhizobium sp.]|uniref:hypothetical protein n=1 Tax=Bradyrhizobium sp. TaxID=376 RepID=UPI003C5587A4
FTRSGASLNFDKLNFGVEPPVCSDIVSNDAPRSMSDVLPPCDGHQRAARAKLARTRSLKFVSCA